MNWSASTARSPLLHRPVGETSTSSCTVRRSAVRGTNRAPSQSTTSPSVGRIIPTTVTIQGAGFDPTTVVQFIDSQGVVHTPTVTLFVSSSTLALDLNLTNWPASTYDVRIVKGGTTITRSAAFTVVPGGTPHLETRIVAPAVMAFRV